jgi:hypothetical protein
MPGYFGGGRVTWNTSWYMGTAVVTAAELDDEYPMPWRLKFWRMVVNAAAGSNILFAPPPPDLPVFGLVLIFLAWPLMTLASVTVFRTSIRQAKIRSSHIVRTIIYSCDFGLLIVAATIVASFLDQNFNQGWLLAGFAATYAAITAYRLTIAFRQYLRVHLPVATVLASQLIAFLIVFIVLVQIADFSRRI